jgi:hypothetical protein
MTVNVAGRRGRASRKTETAAEPPIAIGEIEQTVFLCPGCSRPLAFGVRRCPGCGTHLVMRVELKRASAFVVMGLLAGFAVGGGLTAASFALDRPAREAEIAAAAAAAALAAAEAAEPDPVATSKPLETPATGSSGSGATGGVPAITRSALGQAVTVDGRLASSAAALVAASGAGNFDTIEVAAILRSLSADAVFGLQLTSHIGAWSGGAEVGAALTSFYTAIQDTAAEGLTASIRNEAAYRAASTKMIQLLGGLAPLDESLRAAAAEAGVTVP